MLHFCVHLLMPAGTEQLATSQGTIIKRYKYITLEQISHTADSVIFKWSSVCMTKPSCMGEKKAEPGYCNRLILVQAIGSLYS